MPKRFLSCIEACPTPWHAAKWVGKELENAGFLKKELGTDYGVKNGEHFYVARGGTIFAVSMPKKTPKQCLIIGSHTDSPSLKLKHLPEVVTDGYHMLSVDSYGGPLLQTYFDRDLYIAGRVFVEEKGRVKEKLIGNREDAFTIPSLAIHLENKDEALKKQTHLRALYSLKKESPFPKNVLGHDLFLVPCEPPRLLRNGCISGYRLDNLASVYGTLTGFLKAKAPAEETVRILALYNHEEFGSSSDEGALSPLLTHLLNTLFETDTYTEHSRLISVDNAHALHPNYTEKYDKEHAPLLGKGVAIKHHANNKYATNGRTAAELSLIAKKANIPLQHFQNHSDGRSGSTIGNLASCTLGIPTVDIGIPQLAMHSIRELMAAKDIDDLSKLTQALMRGP